MGARIEISLALLSLTMNPLRTFDADLVQRPQNHVQTGHFLSNYFDGAVVCGSLLPLLNHSAQKIKDHDASSVVSEKVSPN
jgi:hypothetical protein